MQAPGDQAQWFVVEVPAAGLLLITADELSDSDPVLSVFDGTARMARLQRRWPTERWNSELIIAGGPGPLPDREWRQ